MLEEAIEGMSPAALDWRIVPGATTAGENVLHIAAFEFCIVSAVDLSHGRDVDNRLWASLRPGFGRLGGFEEVNGLDAACYLSTLRQVRQKLLSLISRLPPDSRVARRQLRLADLASVLRSLNPGDDPRRYERMREAVLSTMGPLADQPAFDLLELLLSHESYHRGQVLLLRYLHRNLDPDPE